MHLMKCPWGSHGQKPDGPQLKMRAEVLSQIVVIAPVAAE
jgi:hypothetical protein